MCRKCDPEDITQKYCSGCESWKTRATEFSGNKSQKDGHCNWCKDCDGAKAKAYNSAHREEVNAKGREYYNKTLDHQVLRKQEYYKENKETIGARNSAWKFENKFKVARMTAKRRMLMREVGSDGTLTAEAWEELCELYGNKCLDPECTDPARPLTVDHVIPISLGGLDSIHNVQPLCQPCNSKKHAKVKDFRPFR